MRFSLNWPVVCLWSLIPAALSYPEFITGCVLLIDYWVFLYTRCYKRMISLTNELRKEDYAVWKKRFFFKSMQAYTDYLLVFP